MEETLIQKIARKRHKVRGKDNPPRPVLLSQPQIDRVNDSRIISLLGEMLALDLEGREGSYSPHGDDGSWALYLAMSRKLVKPIQIGDRITYTLTQKGKGNALNITSYYRYISEV